MKEHVAWYAKKRRRKLPVILLLTVVINLLVAPTIVSKQSVPGTQSKIFNESAGQIQQEWVARYTGVGSYVDVAKSIGIDGEGNVYVTGSSKGEPGETEPGYYDIVTIKYNSTGGEQWVRRWDNQLYHLDDFASSMVVDFEGNIYIAGKSLVGDHLYSLVLLKYNSLGEKQWENFYPGGFSYVLDYPEEIVLDGNGNIYVSGSVKGEQSQFDICTLKYTTDGEQLWVRTYNADVNGNDTAQHLAVKNNVVVVVGEVSTEEIFTDFITIKYTDEGELLWVKTYNFASTNDGAMAVAIDDLGNIYITGSSNNGLGWYAYDFATIKYALDGTVVWIQRYDALANESPVASCDFVNDIVLNTDGTLVVAGKSTRWSDLVDFYTTVCYTLDGELIWVDMHSVYRGAPPALTVDHAGNIYLTGSCAGGPTYHDYFTMRYNSTGDVAWTQTYNGPGNYWDKAADIAVDDMGNVYTTGYSCGVGTDEDYTTIKYHQTDVTPPVVTIVKPKTGYFYLADQEMMKRPFSQQPLIFGKITIEVNASDTDTGVRNVAFLIDDVVIANDTTVPYTYRWEERMFVFPSHRLSVVVVDYAGNSITAELEAQKFL